MISNIAKKYAISTDFLRPKNLSDDKTKLIDVYRYVVKEYLVRNLKFDEIWFLSACSPLVEANNLKKAANFFNKNINNSFLSINKCSTPVQWSMQLRKDKKLFPLFPNLRNVRSQDLKSYYIDNGAFGAYKSEIFYKNKKINYAGYNMNNIEVPDIDNQFDWSLTEMLYKLKKTKF